MTPQRIILRVENRVSIGLFRPMMMLLYICFITLFFPQLIFAETKPLTLNTEKDLKIVEAADYNDGTIILRLLNPNNCTPNLWFNIISPDGTSNSLTVEKHSIPQDNFCSNRPLIKKRHTPCENGGGGSTECCSQFPDSCTDKPAAAATCQTNPNLDGCKSFCDSNPAECAAAKAQPKDAIPKDAKVPAKDAIPKDAKVPAKDAKVPAKEQPKTPVPVPAKTPTKTPAACDTNPYGPGCNVDCGKTPTPPGCANVPNCSQTPGVPGCIGGLLDCGTFPNSPQCACDYNPYSINCANVPDCNSTPTPPACANVPNCKQNPNTPGCVGNKLDCNLYPKSPDCKSIDCGKNPNAPGCGSLTDSIRIHAISSGFILVAYYCSITTNRNVCGSIINWKGFEVNTIKFEESCTDGIFVESINDKGFAYVCYKSDSKKVFWNTYGAPINEGDVSSITSNTLSYDVETFSSTRSHVFATEDGGYSIITSTLSSGSGATVYSSFIQKVSTNPVKGPFTIYTDNSQTLTDIRIYACTIAFQSSGYSCLIKTTDQNQVEKFVNVDFLSNGKAVKSEFDLKSVTGGQIVTDVIPLNYGGYVIITTDSTTGKKSGYVIDNKGKFYKNWGLTDDSYNKVVVLSNNTIVAIPNAPNDGTATTIITTDQVTSFSTIEGGGDAPGGPGGYGSSKIISTTPSKGATVAMDGSKKFEEFTITYIIPIIASTGNFSVFQVNGTNGNGILKQTVPAANDQFVSFDSSETIVKLSILESVLNTKDGSYYVTVDNDFVKEKSNGQNIIGIRQKIWAFTTTSTTATTGGGSDSAIIRLTPEGTRNYISLPSNNRTKFEETMSEGIAKALPCDQTRLKTIGYQYDGHTKEDQVILRVDIRAATPQEPSSEQLVNNLNDMVINKDITTLTDGKSTSFLDASNGAPRTEKLWPKYWWILLLSLILFALLIGIFIFARIKNKDGRNFLAIFLFAFLPIDLLLDIIFVSLHGRDFKWVLPASLFFLLFPLLLNIIFTYFILKKEKTGKKFKKWWKKNPTTAKAFTAASCIDTDALQEVSSRAGGAEALSAPFSPEGENKILFATGVVAFLEDIPQFIIYCIYLRYHIKPAIVPILVLSSCIIVLILKLFSITCYTCCYRRDRGPQNDKESVIGEESSSSSSSSDEDEKIPYNPNTTDSARVPKKDGGRGERGPQEPIDEYGNIRPENEKDDEKDDEKPVDSTPSAPTDGKDAKKPGITAALFGKKPKKPKKEDEDDDEKDDEKPVDSTPSAPTDGKDAKKPGITAALFGKKPKKPKKEDEDDDEKDDEKPVDSTPSAPTDGKDAKKPGITTALFGKKPKKPKKEDEDDEEKVNENKNAPPQDTGTTREDIKDDTAPTRTNIPERDSTIRESTVEAYRQYIADTEGLENLGGDSAGASNSTVLGAAGYSSYGGGYNYGGGYIIDNNNTKTTTTTSKTGTPIIYGTSSSSITKDKLTGAAISGVTVAGGATTTTRYIIIMSEDDEKEEKEPKEKTVISTTTTSSDDGKEFITKTSSGEIYTTTITDTTEGKYITKSSTGGEKYTTIKEGDKYITRTISGEEYITIITTTTTTITTTTKTTTTTSGVDDDKEYVTRPKSGKGGYIITKTSGVEIIEGGETTTTTYITGEEIPEDTDTTTTTTYITREGEDTGATTRKPTKKSTKQFTDQYGITTITTTEEITENGKITTIVTTVKKDKSGREISTNTETYVTEFVEEPEGVDEETTNTTTYITGGDENVTTTGSSRRKPLRKETKTVEDGIETIITEDITIDEYGKKITTITTVKKDSNGREISTDTQTHESIDTEFTERGAPTITYTTTGGDEGEETTTTTTYITGGDEIISTPKTQAGTQTKTSSETDENGIETITTEETVTDENGKTTTTVTTVKKDKSGREISSNTETSVSYAPKTTSKFGGSSIVGPSIYEEGLAKKKKAPAEKHTKSTTPSSSTNSIKRTSSYGRSGGKISRNKSGAKATTSSRVVRSGNKDRLGRVDSNSSMSSLSSTSSSGSTSTE